MEGPSGKSKGQCKSSVQNYKPRRRETLSLAFKQSSLLAQSRRSTRPQSAASGFQACKDPGPPRREWGRPPGANLASSREALSKEQWALGEPQPRTSVSFTYPGMVTVLNGSR